MRTGLVANLGYLLLTAPAVAGDIYAKNTVGFADIVLYAVFGAGALALFLMTYRKANKPAMTTRQTTASPLVKSAPIRIIYSGLPLKKAA